jgi:protein SCO1/2
MSETPPPPPPRRSPVAPIVLGLAITLLVGVAIKRGLNDVKGVADRMGRDDADEASGAPRTNVLADFGPVADFHLTDKEGRPFGLENLRGKIWVLDFVFTSCSGPCPVMTQGMRNVFQGLQAEPDVEFVTVTVDPETDTPDVLDHFAKASGADNPRWHWLTGDKAAIRELAVNSFFSPVGDKVEGNQIVHSTRFFVVDRNARLRMVHDTTTNPDPAFGPSRGVIETVKTLLAKQPRPEPAKK